MYQLIPDEILVLIAGENSSAYNLISRCNKTLYQLLQHRDRMYWRIYFSKLVVESVVDDTENTYQIKYSVYRSTNGFKQGIYMERYINSRKIAKVCEYIDNKLCGIYIECHKDSIVKLIVYNNGIKDGNYIKLTHGIVTYRQYKLGNLINYQIIYSSYKSSNAETVCKTERDRFCEQIIDKIVSEVINTGKLLEIGTIVGSNMYIAGYTDIVYYHKLLSSKKYNIAIGIYTNIDGSTCTYIDGKRHGSYIYKGPVYTTESVYQYGLRVSCEKYTKDKILTNTITYDDLTIYTRINHRKYYKVVKYYRRTDRVTDINNNRYTDKGTDAYSDRYTDSYNYKLISATYYNIYYIYGNRSLPIHIPVKIVKYIGGKRYKLHIYRGVNLPTYHNISESPYRIDIYSGNIKEYSYFKHNAKYRRYVIKNNKLYVETRGFTTTHKDLMSNDISKVMLNISCTCEVSINDKYQFHGNLKLYGDDVYIEAQYNNGVLISFTKYYPSGDILVTRDINGKYTLYNDLGGIIDSFKSLNGRITGPRVSWNPALQSDVHRFYINGLEQHIYQSIIDSL